MQFGRFLWLACIAIVACACAGCASLPSAADEQLLVPAVSLEQYAGLWYQVGRYPHWFQGGSCAESTAQYSLLEDGGLEVLNQCWKDRYGGTATQSVKARAMAFSESGNHLRATFYNIFTASYLIVALDPDYRWAAVTTPGKKQLWILSRTPSLEEAEFQQVLAMLAGKGFDVQSIIRTSLQ